MIITANFDDNVNLCIYLISNDDDDRLFVFGWETSNMDVFLISMTNFNALRNGWWDVEWVDDDS